MDNNPLDIPAFLVRDASNRAPFMSNVESDAPAKSRPAKTVKANGAAKPTAKATVKAADKPKAKAAAKPAAKAKTAPKAAAKPAKATAKASKPKADGAKKDKWGFREGSSKSQAVALYAAKGGATLEEVKAAVGSVQLNVLNALEAEGHEVVRKKEVREGKRPATRYFLKAKKA